MMDKFNKSYCQGCLCSDRTLTSIAKYVDIYNKLFDISANVSPLNKAFCWECIAVLTKIKQFKSRVEEVHKILADYNSIQSPILSSLSTLTTVYIDDAILLTYNDDIKPEVEVEVNIKDEIYHSDNDLDKEPLLEEKHDVKIEPEIKNINKKTKSKSIKKKTLHYRFVYDNSREKCELKRRFDIKNNEVLSWIERDRCSEFYKGFKYKCKYCLQGWNCKEKLYAHNIKYHYESIGLYKCDICNYRFNNESDMKAHIDDHNFGYECAICGFQCYTSRRLKAHLFMHRKVQCVHCEVCLSDLQQFRKHYKSVHSVFICHHCGKKYSSKRIIEKHIGCHSATHPCGFCDKSYKSRGALHKHRSSKHQASLPEESYCSLCNKQYESVFGYRQHVKYSAAHAHERERDGDLPQFLKRYKSKQSVYICDHCGKKCSSKRMIEKHMGCHSDTHSCGLCGKSYKTREALATHRSYKHRARPAEHAYCVLCNKQYESVYGYRRHVKQSVAHAHERERDGTKSCPDCGKTYYRKSYMLNHYRHVHTKQSKYYCTDCSRHFLNRTKYLNHMKYTHEGAKKEKNKMCNICGRGFSNNQTLINHVRIHTGERPYECELCEAKFTQKQALQSHVKYIHLKTERRRN